MEEDDSTVIGAAIHSVRAVPRDAMASVAEWTHRRIDGGTRPLHAHLSEQQAENDACLAAYRLSPTQVLAQAGALGVNATMVHATHLSPTDIALLADSRTTTCFCPTTERDLADGIGPARALLDAGSPVALGTDQQAVIDPLEEMRALEMHERLVSQARGRFSLAELVDAGTVVGHRSLGWLDAGRIAVDARADLVGLDLTTVRTAGSCPEQAILAATSADIRTVVSGGQVIVEDGRHRTIDVARELDSTIGEAWSRVER
jgi:formiminoglutamate deiminase